MMKSFCDTNLNTMLLPSNTLTTEAAPNHPKKYYHNHDNEHVSVKQAAQQEKQGKEEDEAGHAQEHLDEDDSIHVNHPTTNGNPSSSHCTPLTSEDVFDGAQHQQDEQSNDTEYKNTPISTMSSTDTSTSKSNCLKIGENYKQSYGAKDQKQQQEQRDNVTKNPRRKSPTGNKQITRKTPSVSSTISVTHDGSDKAAIPCTNNSDTAKKKSSSKYLDVSPTMTKKTKEGEEIEQHDDVKYCQLKRSREKQRRQKISSAIERLTNTLLKVDQSNLVQRNDQVYFGQELSFVNNNSCCNLALNRTKIINHATNLIEKFAIDNEKSKLKVLQLEYDFTNKMIANISPSAASQNRIEDATRSAVTSGLIGNNHAMSYVLSQVSILFCHPSTFHLF
jgi:hypothetical protein